MKQLNRIPIGNILELFSRLELEIIESKTMIEFIDTFCSITNTSSNSIAYVAKKKFLPIEFSNIHGLIILEEKVFEATDFSDFDCSYIVVKHSKYAFAAIHEEFAVKSQVKFDLVEDRHRKFDDSTKIAPDVFIGENVSIGNHALIYPGVRILDGTVIGHHVVIKPNSVIGGDGFGYATRVGFPPLKIPHLGNVIIGNHVDIGSNVTIDKATFGSTIIEDFVKFDNGVHVGHNCYIGERTLLTAHAELSGSVTIGRDSWVAPNASIKESLKIGNNVLVGIGSVVLRDLPDNAVAFGVPAKIIRYQNQDIT